MTPEVHFAYSKAIHRLSVASIPLTRLRFMSFEMERGVRDWQMNPIDDWDFPPQHIWRPFYGISLLSKALFFAKFSNANDAKLVLGKPRVNVPVAYLYCAICWILSTYNNRPPVFSPIMSSPEHSCASDLLVLAAIGNQKEEALTLKRYQKGLKVKPLIEVPQ